MPRIFGLVALYAKIPQTSMFRTEVMIMAEPETWIKLNRNILNWGWYQDSNTKDLFIHLLLTANIEDHAFMGIVVKRGQVATSYPSLAEALNFSIKNVRTSLNHLKTTGEVAVTRYSKFSLITILNYSKYQNNQQYLNNEDNLKNDSGSQNGSQVAVKWQSSGSQAAPIKESKIAINEESKQEALIQFCDENGITREFGERFYKRYEYNGWKDSKGNPVRNWRKLILRAWEKEKNSLPDKAPLIDESWRDDIPDEAPSAWDIPDDYE